MASKPDTSNLEVSPIESRTQAYKRMTKIRHRLFWIHPIGIVIAIVAAGGDAQKLRDYAKLALTVTIIVHVVWALQTLATSRVYKENKS